MGLAEEITYTFRGKLNINISVLHLKSFKNIMEVIHT